MPYFFVGSFIIGSVFRFLVDKPEVYERLIMDTTPKVIELIPKIKVEQIT